MKTYKDLDTYRVHHSYKEHVKLDDAMTNNTIKCKHCGHSIVMSLADRTICSWCGKWIYRTPKIEFRYELRKAMKK